MDMTKRSFKKRINVEALTEEELVQFLNSVDSDCEDEISDDDDSVADPDFVVDNIESQLLDSSDEQDIDRCILDHSCDSTDSFVRAISLSLNISEIEQSSDSSLFVPDVAAVATVKTEEICEPSTSNETTTNANLKPLKRARSPLPIVEAAGPKIQPNSGGFTGRGTSLYETISVSYRCIFIESFFIHSSK